jgi:hypothetical protein
MAVQRSHPQTQGGVQGAAAAGSQRAISLAPNPPGPPPPTQTYTHLCGHPAGAAVAAPQKVAAAPRQRLRQQPPAAGDVCNLHMVTAGASRCVRLHLVMVKAEAAQPMPCCSVVQCWCKPQQQYLHHTQHLRIGTAAASASSQPATPFLSSIAIGQVLPHLLRRPPAACTAHPPPGPPGMPPTQRATRHGGTGQSMVDRQPAGSCSAPAAVRGCLRLLVLVVAAAGGRLQCHWLLVQQELAAGPI